MTGKRDNRVVSYFTDEEVAKLSKWSEDTGKSQSNLVREAVREYLDLDRGDRIERQLAELTDEMEDLRTLVEGEQTHTHSNGGLSSTSAATDGGNTQCVYTPENIDTADPPKTNAAVTRKVDYLAAKVRARNEKVIHREKFREKDVKNLWDYADGDRADGLVMKTIDRLGFKQHPEIEPLYVPKEEYDAIVSEQEADRKAQAEAKADDELEVLDADV